MAIDMPDVARAREGFRVSQKLLLSGFLSHAFDNFATNLGTIFRGIKRCTKMLGVNAGPLAPQSPG